MKKNLLISIWFTLVDYGHLRPALSARRYRPCDK